METVRILILKVKERFQIKADQGDRTTKLSMGTQAGEKTNKQQNYCIQDLVGTVDETEYEL